jgi:hypothetical protein
MRSRTATETLARAIAASDAFSIAGGGDTLAAIAKYGIEKDVGYISTGAAPSLEVLKARPAGLRDPAEPRPGGATPAFAPRGPALGRRAAVSRHNDRRLTCPAPQDRRHPRPASSSPRC